jgi:hypothetical protein
MTQKLAAAAALTALTALAVSACDPAPDSHPAAGTPAAGSRSAASSPAPARRAGCSAEFVGGNGSGITAFAGTVTGTVSITCTDTPQDPNWLINFGYVPTGDLTAMPSYPGTAPITTDQETYTITAPCKPGTWVLDVTMTATVDGVGIATPTHGTFTPLTANDCA